MMKHSRDNPEIRAQATYLKGYADCLRAMGQCTGIMDDAIHSLERMARETCGAGYVGCHGGPTCSSDHK